MLTTNDFKNSEKNWQLLYPKTQRKSLVFFLVEIHANPAVLTKATKGCKAV